MTDLILSNATVVSLDPHASGSAIAISQGRISAVGTEGAVREGADPRTVVVDLSGLAVCPGFIDTHQHASFAAFEPIGVDCSTPPLERVRDVLATLEASAATQPPGRWIRAWGFNAGKVAEGRNPTRAELDDVAPSNPLLLVDLSFHAGYVNSTALRDLGIGRDTPDPPHGQIVRDASGEPTGELLEGAIDGAQLRSWRSLAVRSIDESVGLLEQYCRRALSHGITALGDALVTTDGAALYQLAAAEGRLPLTVQQLFGAATFFGRPDPGLAMLVEANGPRLRGGAMKLFMDKVHPDGPAITCLDQDQVVRESGDSYYTVAELEELAGRAVSMGIAPATHAIGNRAIDAVLDAYAAVRRVHPHADARLRLEHFSLGTLDQVKRAAALGVTVSTQPILAYSWGDAFVEWRRGDKRLRVLPLHSLIDAGVMVAGGSDYPCDKLPPLLGMWAAVARSSESGAPIDPEEGVTPEEALRMYTANAAVASGREDEEGTITPGKRANLVVLDGDPLSCTVDGIREIGVVQTYVDGERVFHREQVTGGA